MIIKGINIKEAVKLKTYISEPPIMPRFWYKGGAGINGGSPTTGDVVDTWADQSGNGFDFTQTVPANKPTWRTGIINGEPAIEFTNPTFLTNMGADLFTTDETTISMVVLKTGNPSGGQLAHIMLLNAATFGSPGGVFLSFQDSITVPVSNQFYFNTFNNLLDDSWGANSLVPEVLTIVKTTTTLELRRNGVTVVTNASTQSLQGINLNHYIGSWFNANRTFEGYIGEIIGWDEALTGQTLTDSENYLRFKYNTL